MSTNNTVAADAQVQVDEQIKDIKSLRVELDGTLQKIRNHSSREVSLSITKVQEAIMWLGMELKRLGAVNPYPNSYKPDNAIVEPTADNLQL